MSQDSIGYDVVLALHIVTGFVGFAALGMTGFYANQAANEPDSPPVQRFFRRGTNWAARALFLVPLFGVALLYMAGDPSGEARHIWVVAGVVLWCVAAAAAVAILWPAERTLQEWIVSAGRGAPGEGSDHEEVRRACRRISATAAVADVAYVVAVVLMVAKP